MRTFDAGALLQHLMGENGQGGLSLLDPIGASPYRWVRSHRGYFAMVNRDVAAIVEPDKSGSGLYHSRLYTREQGKEPMHQWIEPTNLPLRQQVALVHEATGVISYKVLLSREARWLDEPATDNQLATLKRFYPDLQEQIDQVALTKGQASDAIHRRLLRRTLAHPPSPEK